MSELLPVNIFDFDLVDPGDAIVPINYQIADFRNIQTRNGAYTKTIIIPGTKRNDTQLSLAFDISYEGFWDRNKRKDAFIEVDNIRLLEGTMQLKKVNIIDDIINQYEILLKGQNSNWAETQKDKSIKELPFDNHIFNEQNIVASWNDNGDTSEYYYPLIDYGDFATKTETDNIAIERLRPGVYVKPILIKIFKDAGYKLIAPFFDRQEIRDLFLPFMTDALYISEETRALNETRVSLEPDAYILPAGITRLQFNHIQKDGADNWDSPTKKYTCRFDGTYNMELRLILSMINTNISARTLKIKIFAGGLATQKNITVKALTFKRQLKDLTIVFNDRGLTVGQPIYVQLENEANGLEVFVVQSTAFAIIPAKLLFSDGSEVDLAETLPEIKQMDFLRAWIQACNLYITTNERDKIVRIFTRDEFFLDIEHAKDWSDKLDISQEQELEQIEDGINKTLNFKYKEDTEDEKLEDFENRWDVKYGNTSEVLENEFLAGEKDVASLPFAATYMGLSFTGTLYMPLVRDKDAPTVEKFKWIPRILINGGLVNPNFGDEPATIWRLEGTNYTHYPFAYSIKEISTPFDISLLFENQSELGLQSNDKGLVDKFYRTQINQINNNRIFTAWLLLDIFDIKELIDEDINGIIGFRKPILINGTYYYVNKVNDYLAGQNKVTKVELIQK